MPAAAAAVLGQLAALDPNGSSILNGPPFNLPGYTNREAGLLVGEATFALLGGLEPAPFYHFTGGVFGPDGKPAGLLYSNEADLFTFEQGAAPLQPNRELADADTDVTTNIVHKVPSTQRLLDYGHADLFLASNAEQLVWQPLLAWLRAH